MTDLGALIRRSTSTTNGFGEKTFHRRRDHLTTERLIMLTTFDHFDTDEARPVTGPKLTVVSSTEGRMRLRFSGCRLDSVHALRIEDTVGKVAGVRAVQGYRRTASLVIWYSPGRCDSSAILLVIADLVQIPAASVTALAPRSSGTGKPSAVQHIISFAARTLTGQRDDAAPMLVTSGRDARSLDRVEFESGSEQLGHSVTLRRAAWSATLLTASMLTAWISPLAPIALPLKMLSLALGASTFVPSAVQGLGRGRVGVDTLMTTAALGTVGLGQVGDAAKMACLVSLTEGLEECSAARARHSLRTLLSLAPDHATVLREGAETVVAAADMRAGDLMIVRPGERLATDGVVRDGRSLLDLSAISGKSTQAVAAPGDAVFAGATNSHATLRVEVTARTANSSLARIADFVDSQAALEEAAQQVADRTARPLVPGLMLAALLVAAAGGVLGSPALWLKRALMVLAVGSPHAMDAIGVIGGIAVDQVQTLAANSPRVIDSVDSSRGTRRRTQTAPIALAIGNGDPLAAAVA